MATSMHSATTPNTGKSMSQRRPTGISSRNISLSLLQTPTSTLPFSGLGFLLEAAAATTADDDSTLSLPPPSGKSMSKMRSAIKSSSMKTLSLTSPLHASSDDALVASRLDVLQEMHLRRQRAYKKAQKAAREERTLIFEEASQIIYEGW